MKGLGVPGCDEEQRLLWEAGVDGGSAGVCTDPPGAAWKCWWYQPAQVHLRTQCTETIWESVGETLAEADSVVETLKSTRGRFPGFVLLEL